MTLNAILRRGMHFILDTYIHLRYPCIKLTQTNIYSQLARISFLCTIFFFFYLLDHRFAWYQYSSSCLAINGGHVRSVSWAPDGCCYCCSRLNMNRVPGLPGSAAAVWLWIEYLGCQDLLQPSEYGSSAWAACISCMPPLWCCCYRSRLT